jgi:hypothetical protein
MLLPFSVYFAAFKLLSPDIGALKQSLHPESAVFYIVFMDRQCATGTIENP